MSQTQLDYLIIGQGLAGSALAWQLIESGQRICVLDDGHRSASSTVAAGLINPLAGMRFNRRPELDDWLPAAEAWYAQLAERFGQTFHHPIMMLRLLRSEQQRRFHTRRREDPASRPLLEDTFDSDHCPEPIAVPHGGFLQHRTAYVDMPGLLERMRDWLIARNALRECEVDYDALRITDRGVELAGLRARQLVFCEGAGMRFNPWFRDLPLTPDKGEIIDLQIEGWQPRHIINGAHWLVPQGQGRVRLGSTHEHHRLDLSPTADGRRQLLDGLRQLTGPELDYHIAAHQAGIRPASSDRYPLLGRHPRHPALAVCNGFGARGALTIPWYTRQLANHLQHDTTLPAEADIARIR